VSLRASCGQYACGRKGRLNRGIGPESAGITRASRKPRKSVRHESPLFALAKKLSALRILKPACCGLRSHRVQPSCSSCSVSPMRGVEARARGRGAALPSQVVLLLRDAREGPLRPRDRGEPHPGRSQGRRVGHPPLPRRPSADPALVRSVGRTVARRHRLQVPALQVLRTREGVPSRSIVRTVGRYRRERARVPGLSRTPTPGVARAGTVVRSVVRSVFRQRQ